MEFVSNPVTVKNMWSATFTPDEVGAQPIEYFKCQAFEPGEPLETFSLTRDCFDRFKGYDLPFNALAVVQVRNGRARILDFQV